MSIKHEREDINSNFKLGDEEKANDDFYNHLRTHTNITHSDLYGVQTTVGSSYSMYRPSSMPYIRTPNTSHLQYNRNVD
jgi:hypothetical protein